MQFALPLRHAPDIEFVRCDVKVAAQQHVRFEAAVLVEHSPEPVQPIELERKFFRPQLGPVRYVGVDDPHAVDRSGDQAFGSLRVVLRKALLYIADLVF